MTIANENSARYINTAETAKMIRAALKEAFPGVTFGVRSHVYSGGSSIRVDWLDGPTQAMVDALIGEYRGQGFDGMTDSTYGIRHWLMKDGSVQVAVSNDPYAPVSTERPDGAELVSFGSNHVFTTRKLSPAFMQQAFARLQRKFGPEFMEGCEVKVSSYDGTAHLSGFKDFSAEQFARQAINRLMIVRAA